MAIKRGNWEFEHRTIKAELLLVKKTCACTVQELLISRTAASKSAFKQGYDPDTCLPAGNTLWALIDIH